MSALAEALREHSMRGEPFSAEYVARFRELLARHGLAVVPREATKAMIYAGGDILARAVPGMHAEEYSPDDAAEAAWNTMIRAAAVEEAARDA